MPPNMSDSDSERVIASREWQMSEAFPEPTEEERIKFCATHSVPWDAYMVTAALPSQKDLDILAGVRSSVRDRQDAEGTYNSLSERLPKYGSPLIKTTRESMQRLANHHAYYNVIFLEVGLP